MFNVLLRTPAHWRHAVAVGKARSFSRKQRDSGRLYSDRASAVANRWLVFAGNAYARAGRSQSPASHGAGTAGRAIPLGWFLGHTADGHSPLWRCNHVHPKTPRRSYARLEFAASRWPDGGRNSRSSSCRSSSRCNNCRSSSCRSVPNSCDPPHQRVAILPECHKQRQ